MADPPQEPVDSVLRDGVELMVTYLDGNPSAEDDAIISYLVANGLSERQAVKLVQFAPIAFTRFLYRTTGVQFDPCYVLLGADGQPKEKRPIESEPAYREAWSHCERAAVARAEECYFVFIADRSGGYRAIQDLVCKGLNLDGIITSPPVMWE